MFWREAPLDDWANELVNNATQIAELQARQTVLVNNLDKHGIAQRDGARSIVDWVASRLDMARRNASDLVYSARWFGHHRSISSPFADGLCSFDRAMATVRLARAGADAATVAESCRLDLDGLARLTARHRRFTSVGERRAFADRFAVSQPTLDESSWIISGRLPGIEGRIFAKAMQERADEFRDLPGGEDSTRGQRQADALVAMAQDSLDRDADEAGNTSGSSVAVFVDLDRANGTGGELGAEVEYGPRVGPNTLAELLCTGSVQVIGLDRGHPVVTSAASKAIPPAVRRNVAWRDGGCTIDGCTSRYRLQPHHISERRHGGDHDPDNLTTLCWYHHHVAIHGRGFRIDPHSPPRRRRLIRSRAGPDPP